MRLLSNSGLLLFILFSLTPMVKSPDLETAKFQNFTTPKHSLISMETQETNPCDFRPEPCQAGGTQASHLAN